MQSTEKSIKDGLQAGVFGQNIIYKQSTTSTQTIAHDLAKKDAKHGTVIVANEQTEPRGRLNRPWVSLRDKAISMSIILRPDMLPHLAPQLTLFAATVISQSIEKHTNINPQIKWPNDLLINDKKFVGILTEMSTRKNKIDYIIIGIGVNVNHSIKELPNTANYKATSLAVESNQLWDISQLIQVILEQFEQSYKVFLDKGFAPFKKIWESYGYKLGKKLLINDFKAEWYGTILGISDDGALLVTDEAGEIKKIHSAEIEWYNN